MTAAAAQGRVQVRFRLGEWDAHDLGSRFGDRVPPSGRAEHALLNIFKHRARCRVRRRALTLLESPNIISVFPFLA